MKSHYEILAPYRQQYQQESNEPDLISPEARHKYAMFVKGNDHLINGRTYCSKDEDGNYISCFVSQYSDIIERNLEPGIRKAVLSLHEKGYLTFTSCQGHDDSRHRYIGVLFNTKEQKHDFISEVDKLDCNVYWYDNVLNSVERPCTESEWWDDGGMTVHIVYDDKKFHEVPQQKCRENPYTDEELTKFWNIQSNRNYSHYECIVFSFGYPMVETSFWKAVKKYFFYDQTKVNAAYSDFLTKVDNLSDYLA
jgi:hypothetical protein